MIDVKGDGNCLFRCVALALEGTQNTHSDYREICANAILSNPQSFQDRIHSGILKDYNAERNLLDQYAEQVRKGGIMGGLIELQALSLGLNVQFNVEGIGSKELEIGLTHNPKRQISLCRIKNQKYQDGHYMFKRIHKVKRQK